MSNTIRFKLKGTICRAAAAAALLAMAAEPAHALVAQFSFAGAFDMYDPAGGLVWHDDTLTGTISMDMTTFGGTAQMQDSSDFFGYFWTAHDIQLTMNPDFSVNAYMKFDWNGNNDMQVWTQFQLTPSAVNPGWNPLDLNSWLVGDQFTVSSNDADGDGIPGNKMATPPNPFIGFSPAFSGLATFAGFQETCVTLPLLPPACAPDPLATIPNNNIPATPPSVPVPTAAWLFGSGVLGLVGIGRRKQVA